MGILTKTISSLSFFFVALILPGFIAQASPIQPLLHLDGHLVQIQVESGALGSASHASAMPAAEVNAGAQPRQVVSVAT
ncbi:hypothetical protein AGABI1DRAFT_129748 [Agaricus bisporus var. burnettii JB137-S8]|uniref:Uncharacterized protein n=1 Tax=Agaricus bisporus var. burnettii (strain JB137-S8 / ATCC MYA-4627 / FGSC 10392) TaxID=597362 RepID=K5X4T9_AGABU|nr:uncharacterized protein AGABI1DRAFT_129748 [Agaricus bisporus var. burnettii JB137-S8]EKM77962.1 hypothetical protein AGABI1DRAFT_129748 [Agaricus bisporus var. burnettii JB137-S8]